MMGYHDHHFREDFGGKSTIDYLVELQCDGDCGYDI